MWGNTITGRSKQSKAKQNKKNPQKNKEGIPKEADKGTVTYYTGNQGHGNNSETHTPLHVHMPISSANILVNFLNSESSPTFRRIKNGILSLCFLELLFIFLA